MTLSDLSQVLALENLCYTTPWSLNSFRYELGNSDAILQVAVLNARIIGYVCVRTILDMTHLLNITVMPEFRRKGVAGMLLGDVIDELKRIKPGVRLTLEVRQSNIAAIRLYEKFGFQVTGRRKKYYQKPEDDALLMERGPG
jgi:ribosomal-protein-alanine N-acetyltransferase